jgi:Protein of unknown function (DUF4038)
MLEFRYYGICEYKTLFKGVAMEICVKMFLIIAFSGLIAGIPSFSMAAGAPSPPSGLSVDDSVPTPPPPPTEITPPPPPTEITPPPSTNPEFAIKPVTVIGNRFYSNGKPYFPSANFLTSPAGFTHLYLSRSTAQKKFMRDATKAAGHNAMFVYTINEKDYGGPTFTPYVSGIIGGTFDEVKINNWRNELITLLNDNIRPVIWLVPDDAPTIHSAGSVELKRYIQKMVRSFSDLPVMWVLALEADEYFTQTLTNDLGSYLGSLTTQPVGLHQLWGKANWMTASWVDFAAYQYGSSGTTWEQIYSETLSKRSLVGTKPFLAAEYEYTSETKSKPMGLAAAFAGAAGIGNGGPGTLDEFMQNLPDNMVPSKSGNRLFLTGSGVTAIADLTDLTFKLSSPTN